MKSRLRHQSRPFKITDLPLEEQKQWYQLINDFIIAFFFQEESLACVEQDQCIVDLWRCIFEPQDPLAEPTYIQIRAVGTRFNASWLNRLNKDYGTWYPICVSTLLLLADLHFIISKERKTVSSVPIWWAGSERVKCSSTPTSRYIHFSPVFINIIGHEEK